MKYSDLTSLDIAIKSVTMNESPSDECPEGQYFCNDEQKCKSIPSGHKVMKDGTLIKEWTYDDNYDIILESLASAMTVKKISTKELVSTYLWLVKGFGQRLYKDKKDPEWQKAADVLRDEMQRRAKSGDEIAKKAITSKGPNIVGVPNVTSSPTTNVPVLRSSIRDQIQKKPSAMKALIKKIIGKRM